jgi:amino acid transporter
MTRPTTAAEPSSAAVAAGGLRRELGVLPLAAVIFFNVSGGPYGIEDGVSSFGPGLALALLVLTPLVWSLPVALAMSELASAIPDAGGYVTWVRRAFGPFWSFQVGWWSWVNSFVDMAVYPALFVEYVQLWWPDMAPAERWLLALAFIWGLTLLNIIGVSPVGRGAIVCGVLCLLPVAALTVVGFAQAHTAPWRPWFAPGQSWASIGVGLSVMMWNYSGWDTPATVLGETRAPERAFRSASFLALAVISLGYILPVIAALAAGSDWTTWTTGSLPQIAAQIAGPVVGHLTAAGAIISTAGLFLALLLTNSRLPFVLARDGQMPPPLAAVHDRFGTPVLAVVVSAVIYSVFAVFSFEELVVMDIWLYSVALIVELAAFLRLRRLEPGLPRPYRVPGGRAGAITVTMAPIACSLLAMATAGVFNTVVAVAVALTGPIAYAGFSGSRR